MKKILPLLIAASLFVVSCEKTITTPTSTTIDDNGGGSNIPVSSVPASVIAAYNSLFSGGTNVQWKLLDGNYKVELYIDAVKWQAIFSPAGALLKKERA